MADRDGFGTDQPSPEAEPILGGSFGDILQAFGLDEPGPAPGFEEPEAEVQPFLSRYYDLIDDLLSDPTFSTRITKQRKLWDFKTAEKTIYERLMRAAGQDSGIGRAEATITVENEVEHYQLPGNFRQFWTFRKYNTEDPRLIDSELRTIHEF
ncbi:MAG: hypothetical protein ACYSVY_26340, partial [Planctomycetota bacterium]